MNCETVTEQMPIFFRGFSEFYPDFDRHLRQHVLENFPFVAHDEENE